MKYLSLLLFTVALVLTWKVIHKDPEITFETHSGIQEKLAAFIVETIKVKKPQATDINIEKVWTEPTGEAQVKAFFIYSYKDTTEEGVITTQIQGQGVLERQGLDESGADRWQDGLFHAQIQRNRLVSLSTNRSSTQIQWMFWIALDF